MCVHNFFHKIKEWYDENLSWDPNDHNGISSINIPCDNIWVILILKDFSN